MRRVVLDTNQLVSSVLSAPGLQRRLVDAWRDRAFVLLVPSGQIDEVAEVLRRPKIARKYRVAPHDVDALLGLLRTDGLLLPEAEAPGVCRDPDDDRLLGAALVGGAEYLVTGDRDVLAVGQLGSVSIVGAREFLTRLSL